MILFVLRYVLIYDEAILDDEDDAEDEDDESGESGYFQLCLEDFSPEWIESTVSL